MTHDDAMQGGRTVRTVVKPPVAWSRPHEISGELIYTSKCGRFEITRRHYQLPTASIGYRLRDSVTRKSEVYDSLRDAKEWANLIVDPDWGNE